MRGRKARGVGNEKVKVAITLKVYEAGARAPSLLLIPKTSRFCNVGESAIPVITIKDVLSEAGTKNVVEAVVVVISYAYSTSPAGKAQAGLFSDVGKSAVTIVLVQPIGCACRSSFN